MPRKIYLEDAIYIRADLVNELIEAVDEYARTALDEQWNRLQQAKNKLKALEAE